MCTACSHIALVCCDVRCIPPCRLSTDTPASGCMSIPSLVPCFEGDGCQVGHVVFILGNVDPSRDEIVLIDVHPVAFRLAFLHETERAPSLPWLGCHRVPTS